MSVSGLTYLDEFVEIAQHHGVQAITPPQIQDRRQIATDRLANITRDELIEIATQGFHNAITFYKQSTISSIYSTASQNTNRI